MKLTQDSRPEVEQQRIEARNKKPGLVKTAAFSVLKDYEECPYRVYLSKVKKIKKPSSEAAERGQVIHDIAEQYIRGEGEELPLPKQIDKLPSKYLQLRRRFEAHPERFQLEQNWGFTKHWTDTDWFADDVWLRQKLDVFEHEDETSAIIYDHKSGKKWGNELKHGDQGLQYAIGAFMKYPKLQFIATEFLYVDKGEILPKRFTRKQVEPLVPRLESRILALTTADEFTLQRPKPSKHNCRFCPHAETGACEYAVR